MKPSSHTDLYSQVTDEIIASLEAGVRPWTPSWAGASLPQRANRVAYRGINIMLLWASASRQGFVSPYWLTFKQALELGGCVRKGQKGSTVVYSNTIVREGDCPDDEQRIPFLKRYTVFNLEQIEGISHLYLAPVPTISNNDERVDALDEFFAAAGIGIRHGGSSAFYNDRTDEISIPAFADFRSADAYYATLAHEAIHASGHPERLGRETLRDYHTSVSTRAKEEMIAEVGAAYLCAALGTAAGEREDHASYISSWMKLLKNDKRAIFRAATAAQAAADCILGLSNAALHCNAA